MVLALYFLVFENESVPYIALMGENRNVNIRIELPFDNVHGVLNLIEH